MKDIKSLYLAAKNSGKKNDISAYAEAVHEMFENSPNDYISNLEYIIQSDIGIKTLHEFVEKHGLPISCYDPVMEQLEACIDKSQKLGVDSAPYQEAVQYLEDFRQKYISCFMMESFFRDQCPDNYVKTYYGSNKAGIPNRKLAAGLLETFGEYAIPDIIVTADKIGANAMETAISYIESNSAFCNPATCEWVLECVRNIMPETNGAISMMESMAASGILRTLRERNHQSYREAVITGNDDMMVEYSEEEIAAIQDLISINEYKMTWADELKESATGIQDTIYSLYEEFDGLVDENGELLVESKNKESAAAKKIFDNINHIRKEVLKRIRPVVNDAVKQHNKESGFFKRIQYPFINVMFKDKDDENKILVKNHIKKNLDDIAYSEKEFIDVIHLGLKIEIDSSTRKQEKKSIDLFLDSIAKALSPLIERGDISFKKSDNYYISLTYWVLPIYISKNCMMDGVELDFAEAGIDFEEFVADSVIPMLPNAAGEVQPMEERPWLVNTRNKKTGDIPGYIKRNHNLGYGEDDGASSDHSATSDTSDGTAVDSEPTLDDFKRPSADDMSTPYSGLDEPKEEPKEEPSTPLTPEEKKAINNYYYYTYNNSLNTNKGSFNRDSSSHDDHSTHNITRRNVDDHSTGKRVNSDNINSKDDEEVEVGESYNESAARLNPFISKSKARRDKMKPDIHVYKYLPITEEEFDEIINKVDEVNKKLESFLDEINKKYPIYGLESEYDGDFQTYGVMDGIDGVCVREVDGHYIFDITYPMLMGYDIYDFMDHLKKEHPEEFNKLDDGEGARGSWSYELWYDHKFLDYDKNLCVIINDIEAELKKITDGVFGFEFWDDWDDLCFGFYLTCKSLYPKFDAKDIKKTKEKFVSKFAKALPKKYKDCFFKGGSKKMTEASQFPWELNILTGNDDVIMEEVGDADKDRPKSDHPVKDILTDVDRALVKKQQGAKRVVQNVQNVGRALTKPATRTKQWVDNMVHNWKDADENSIKEKMADPHARSNLFTAIRTAIVGGSLLKAGLLLNPVFLVLTGLRGLGKNKRDFRLRNEMIGELKTEMQIIDEKIKDADRVGDNKAKYKLMRFKNELNKKLLRVGGPKGWKKMI